VTVRAAAVATAVAMPAGAVRRVAAPSTDNATLAQLTTTPLLLFGAGAVDGGRTLVCPLCLPPEHRARGLMLPWAAGGGRPGAAARAAVGGIAPLLPAAAACAPPDRRDPGAAAAAAAAAATAAATGGGSRLGGAQQTMTGVAASSPSAAAAGCGGPSRPDDAASVAVVARPPPMPMQPRWRCDRVGCPAHTCAQGVEEGVAVDVQLGPNSVASTYLGLEQECRRMVEALARPPLPPAGEAAGLAAGAVDDSWLPLGLPALDEEGDWSSGNPQEDDGGPSDVLRRARAVRTPCVHARARARGSCQPAQPPASWDGRLGSRKRLCHARTT
jgi:hypothetical protein